jgi:hypothetical protein
MAPELGPDGEFLVPPESTYELIVLWADWLSLRLADAPRLAIAMERQAVGLDGRRDSGVVLRSQV